MKTCCSKCGGIDKIESKILTDEEKFNKDIEDMLDNCDNGYENCDGSWVEYFSKYDAKNRIVEYIKQNYEKKKTN